MSGVLQVVLEQTVIMSIALNNTYFHQRLFTRQILSVVYNIVIYHHNSLQ